ncbi:prenyltransferase/squalene oxidase repeat-containing protein [Methanosarcina siciliae]|uniref:hypothetical protein n=1 Tax=Methanosarcina siciliae TaxID=38027 RepID=UPI00064FA79E|nr:hypothetical protein [Methanosarcina siciliae]
MTNEQVLNGRILSNRTLNDKISDNRTLNDKISGNKIFDNRMLKAVELAIRKASNFIISNQSGEGYWLDFYIPGMGNSSQWVTAYIAYNLSRLPNTDESVQKAIVWLLHTKSSSGWGYHQNCLPDADSTANVVRLLAYYFKKENLLTQENFAFYLHEFADLLASYQDKNTGGFLTYLPGSNGRYHTMPDSAWCISEPSITAMTGNAFLNSGPERFEQEISNAREFLISRQNPAGYWDSYWWDCRIYGTSLACSFLKQLGEIDPVKKAISWLESVFVPSKGWGNGYEADPYPFYTALSLSSLLLFENNIHSREVKDSVLWLIGNQKEDGSWFSKPILRVPDPQVREPWAGSNRRKCEVVTDVNLLFTTATVMGVLYDFLNLSGYYSCSASQE